METTSSLHGCARGKVGLFRIFDLDRRVGTGEGALALVPLLLLIPTKRATGMKGSLLEYGRGRCTSCNWGASSSSSSSSVANPLRPHHGGLRIEKKERRREKDMKGRYGKREFGTQKMAQGLVAKKKGTVAIL
jgi:hypothetical protein